MQNGKVIPEETLQIAEKRGEVKGKREKERYTHLNAEFQQIARRDKKAFLSDQCKEIVENNRMEKTGDLFKKIRDIRGKFHTKMAIIKDRNHMDLRIYIFYIFYIYSLYIFFHRSRIYQEEVARIHRRTTKKTLMTQITTMAL